MNNHDIKMDLIEIRKMIDVNSHIWKNIKTTNCYAYALGLDIPQFNIEDFAYSPGIIGGSKIYLCDSLEFTYADFYNNMHMDFEALNLIYSEIDPMDLVGNEEWKIAIYLTNGLNGYIDFHFLRCREDGYWYHKDGYIGTVMKTDCALNPIKNPKECYLGNRTYDKCYKLKRK